MPSTSAVSPVGVGGASASVDARPVQRQRAPQRHDVVEGDERRLIGRLQLGVSAVLAARNCSSRVAGDALAEIERQSDVQRDFAEADDVDLLRHAVVANDEVGWRQSAQRLARRIGDQHVDADAFDARREGRLRRHDAASSASSGERDDRGRIIARGSGTARAARRAGARRSRHRRRSSPTTDRRASRDVGRLGERRS